MFSEDGFPVDDEEDKPVSTKIENIMRIVGKTYEEIQDVLPNLPYNVQNKDSLPVIMIGIEEYTPKEILIMNFSKIKALAEDQMNSTIEEAIVSIPQDIDDLQKETI